MVGLATGMIVGDRRRMEGCAQGRLRDAEVLPQSRHDGVYAHPAVVLHRQLSAVCRWCIGYERATAETYKTFFFPSKPRGKFAGKPVLHPQMLTQRYYFVPVYVSIWILVVTCAAMALVSPTATLFATSGS